MRDVAFVEHVVARLSALDTCSVSDALDRLGLPGTVDGLHPCSGDGLVAGRVVTVQLGPPSPQVSSRHLCTAAVESAGATDVIVVAHQGRSDCAGWGGNLSRAARVKGIRGTIVDGAVRDADEARAIGYPVLATGTTPRTARGRAQEHAWNVPVRIGRDPRAVTVATGDFVIADATGVVFVGADRIEDVLAAADAIAEQEAAMAAAIDRGEPVGQVMGAAYEGMLDGSAR